MTGGTVLLYHAFGRRPPAADPHNLFVPVEELRWQLESLLARGWRALTVDEYIAGLPKRDWKPRTFLLTIDDGHASTVEAIPVLTELAIPFLLFIPPAVLGGVSAWMSLMPDSPMLTAAELREISAAPGAEIGAHGWDHCDLPGLAPALLHRNVVECADELERLLGERPRTYAYPRGLFDDAARAAVAAAGYTLAFSTTCPGGQYAIPRRDVNATDTRRSFRLKTSAVWPVAAAAGARVPRLRAVAHRLVGHARR